MSSAVICIVDDDEEILAATRSLLRSFGHAVELFASANAFLADGDPGRFDCVLSDIDMPGASGFDLLARVRAAPAPPPVILMTAKTDQAFEDRAREGGAACFLRKPFDADELNACIDRALTGREP